MRHISEFLFDHYGNGAERQRTRSDSPTHQRRGTSDGVTTGLKTGLADLDLLLGGLPATGLVVVAGESSVGKSSLAQAIVRNIALVDQRYVGVFSLETSPDRYAERLISSATGVDSRRVRSGLYMDSEWTDLVKEFGRLSEAPIFVDRSSCASVEHITSAAREHVIDHGLDLVVIDYLQLVSTERDHRRRSEALAEVTVELKHLSNDVGAPVLVVSQLSNAIRSRQSNVPMLSDFGDAHALVIQADTIILMYREELYDPDTDRRGIVDLIVAKHSNGPTGTVHVRLFDRTRCFADLELHSAAET